MRLFCHSVQQILPCRVHCLAGLSFELEVNSAETGWEVAGRIAARVGHPAEVLMLTSGGCDPGSAAAAASSPARRAYIRGAEARCGSCCEEFGVPARGEDSVRRRRSCPQRTNVNHLDIKPEAQAGREATPQLEEFDL